MADKPQQSGNMFVYILGAIFLLGILLVITKGSFQEGTGIDSEKIVLQVNEVKRYAAELERGVSYVMRNGYSETDIRFAHSNSGSTYGVGINDVPGRQIFNRAGGGVEWRGPPSGAQTAASDWVFNARNSVNKVGSGVDSGSCPSADECVELLAILPNVTKPFCLSVNLSNQITNPAGEPPKEADSFVTDNPFDGTFTGVEWLNVTGGYLNGRTEGCFEGNGGSAALGEAGHYYYYRVLLAR